MVEEKGGELSGGEVKGKWGKAKGGWRGTAEVEAMARGGEGQVKGWRK